MLIRCALTSLRTLLALSLMCGALYPLAVTLLGRALFAERAAGSLVRRGGVIVGSELLGQSFTSPRYFRGRPSALEPPCDPSQSGGANLGPLNHSLLAAHAARATDLRESSPAARSTPPIELVASSGSGLDPHITPAGARWQAARVARERALALEAVLALIDAHVERRTLGVLGEARVNVLRLNLALDELR